MKPDFGWHYPPGVRECDIPGQRPEDIKQDQEYEELKDEVYDRFEDLLGDLRIFMQHNCECLQDENLKEIIRDVVKDLCK